MPVAGVSALALIGITSNVVAFGTGSNAALSGGFGPNQVSTVFGAGAVMLFLLIVPLGKAAVQRLMYGALLLLFAAQSVLTFSRAGLYYAIAAITASSLLMMTDARKRIQLVLGVGILVVVGYFVIFPRMDAYTGGALVTRYADRRLTGRDQIMQADVQIFLNNLIFGVGVGNGDEARIEYYGSTVSAHTEYTRLLSEHGLFGVCAGLSLLALSAMGPLRARTPRERAILTCFTVFGLAFMLGNGMRLALPSLFIGLSQLRIADPIQNIAPLSSAPPYRPHSVRDSK
jgi:O-antigen ligase